MFRLLGQVSIALVILATTGAPVAFASSPTAQPQRCRDAYMDLVQETVILCPGDPTTWVSYTLPTDGFGYSINTYELDEGRSEVQVTYHHRDGRVAVRIMECEADRCVDTASNGVPFP